MKALVKSFYEKKERLTDSLTEILYAMIMERPNIMGAKKKYFFRDNGDSQVAKVRNLYFELEQMRVRAERDRISSYKELIQQLILNN